MESFVTLVGNLTRDPELRFTPSGQGVANFGLACSRRWKADGASEWSEQTSFFDVVAWRETGENAAACLSKGDRVIVVGRLEQRSWETPEGEKRYKVEVVADEVAPSMRFALVEVRKIDRSERVGQ